MLIDVNSFTLGTATPTCKGQIWVTVMEGKTARVVENSEGQWTTPSAVAFTKHGESRRSSCETSRWSLTRLIPFLPSAANG
ncbi:hypothetical protein F5887DRAFT_969906 [Amanita rubescens]|nr:hypothetical protein F5887DRAFT_969906 [Amanita rubescens]